MNDPASTTSKVQPPPEHPHNWREIINGSLEEGFVLIALGTFKELVQPEFIPVIYHIQLLIYLIVNPTKYSIPPDLPLDILSRILHLHRPASFSQAIPFHPSASITRQDKSTWLEWDHMRSDLHKSIWRCMRKCLDEGIWALLWKYRGNKANGKRKRGQDVDLDGEEDEELEGGAKEVSEEGWKLLEWLIKFWEKDRLDDSREISSGYSPLFLKQLPRPFDRTGQLPRNDASYVLSIIKSAYLNPANGEQGDRRKTTAIALLSLVIDTTSGPKPPFHSPSLASSLIHLLTSWSIHDIQDITRKLNRSRNWRASAHVITLLIEDLAGIRKSKIEQRRRQVIKTPKSVEGDETDFEGSTGLDRPTPKYLFRNVLLLSPNDNSSSTKMILLKMELLKIVKDHPHDGDQYKEVQHSIRSNEGWWNSLDKTCNTDSSEIGSRDSINGLGVALKMCVKSLL